MPNRILKDSINESKGLSEVSPFAQDLFKRLITYADDYGRFNGDAEIMRARLFPRELEAVTEAEIEDWLMELVGVGKIRLYTTHASDRRWRGSVVYGYFPNWKAHQRMRESRAKCPDPELEEVNDWALRRFVPMALKLEIFERDGFACRECGRTFALPGVPAKQAMRLLSGALHIDHEVPVIQGGRATAENLRLLCHGCNQARPKQPTLSELARLAAESCDSPQVAAGGGSQAQPRAGAESGGESGAEGESESGAEGESESDAPARGNGPPVGAAEASLDSVAAFGRLLEAFAEREISPPDLVAEPERKAALALLCRWPPGALADCWADYRSGRYGDDFDRRELSFEHLAKRQRVPNWRDWKEGKSGGARPVRGTRNGYDARAL
jgi:5-methylcytosine-specific restriction endonuclease McrA